MAPTSPLDRLRFGFALVVIVLGSVGYALSFFDRTFVVPETLSIAFLGVGGFLLGPAFAGRWKNDGDK